MNGQVIPQVAGELTVLPCPFCGSDATLKPTRIYNDNAMRVVCPRCHIGTIPIIEGEYMLYHGEAKKHFTLDEAAIEAVRIWNNRKVTA